MRRTSLTAALAAAFISLAMVGAQARAPLTPLERSALENHDMISGDSDLAAPAPLHGSHQIQLKHGGAFTDLLIQEAQQNHE